LILNDSTWQYLTSKVNSLLLAKSQFQKVSRGTNKKLPTKNGEESRLVAGTDEISNFDLLKDLAEVVDFLDNSIYSTQ